VFALVVAVFAPLVAAAAIAPTTYQIPLVTTKAADFDVKASAANEALTAAELSTQNRVDAVRAEVAAWVAYDVAKQAAQTSLLELSGISAAMYDTHAAESALIGEPAPDDDVPMPPPVEPGPAPEQSLLRPSRR